MISSRGIYQSSLMLIYNNLDFFLPVFVYLSLSIVLSLLI